MDAVSWRSLLFAAVLLAGCSPPPRLEVNATHPIALAPENRELRVDPTMLANGRDPVVASQVAQFLDVYREAGSQSLAVTVTGQATEPARRAIRSVLDLARRKGVAPERIAAVHVPNGPRRLVLAYVAKRAIPPVCGPESVSLLSDFDNRVSSEFGCATQRNVAAMLANPADLETPRPMTAPDAPTLGRVVSEWRAGRTTGSAAEANEGQAVVSDVGE